MGIVAGAVVGAVFFYWIAGPRVIDPGEFAWLMKLDWRINFLGWHLFRNDPWTLPPGLLRGYLAGEGTTIGFTDAVPLAAFVFKPLEGWLPTPFQYIGLWLLACFALQGLFGALIARVYTRNVLVQSLAAAMFVLAPTLLIRVGHAALTAHFVLLWALWIYVSTSRERQAPFAAYAALGLVAGLIHPYLAAMTLALLVSVPLRDRTTAAAARLAAAVVAMVAAWWAAGFISVSSTTDLSAGGLGLYSMNVLSPVTPQGWSTFLPDLPVAHQLQAYEGFQYLGVGVLVLVGCAVALVFTRRGRIDWWGWLPLFVICAACAIYALSPRVTVGSAVLVDWTHPTIDRLAFFRASGRFFWPMTYLLLTTSIVIVIRELGTRVAIVVLAATVGLQLVDQRNAHAERRATSRSEAFHSWPRHLVSDAWHRLLPFYAHVVLVPASQCGGAPLEHEELAYLAGLHGLTINSGLGARWDEAARRRYCGALAVAMSRGEIEEDTLYVVTQQHEEQLRAALGERVVCGSLDIARICVTAASYEHWRDLVRLT